MIRRLITTVLIATVFGAPVLPPARAQSEETGINAFSVVHGKGTGFRSADKLGTFTGTLQGTFFVDAGEGPVKAGNIVCSADLEIKTEDRSYKGNGRCLITGAEGGEVYGQYSCEGYFLVGCSGMFTLTGGAGRFAGITGGGPMTMRSSVAMLGGGTSVSQNIDVEGIVFWRELKYRLP